MNRASIRRISTLQFDKYHNSDSWFDIQDERL